MLLNLLIKPVWLVLENKVQNYVGHADYGMFIALLSFSYVFSIFADMGLNQYATKQLAISKQFKTDYFPVLFPLKWINALVYPIIIIMAGWFVGYRGREIYYLIIIAFAYSFTYFIAFLRAILRGAQYFNADAIASVSERLLLIGLIGALFWFGLTLEYYIYARTMAVLIVFAGLYWFIKHYFGQFAYRFNWEKTKVIFRASFPFAIILLVYGLNERVDMVLLERLDSSREAGIYAAAYRWVDAAMMYPFTILPIFYARFAAAINTKPEQEKLLQFGLAVIAVPLIFICVFIFFHGRLLFWQFTGSSTQEINTMALNLQLLFGSVLVHGFFAIYSTLLTATNYEKQVSWLIVFSIIINITFNAVFIPVYGSVASAAITLGCAVLVAVGYLVLTRNKLQQKIPVLLIGKLLLATVILAGIFRLMLYWSDAWLWNTIGAGVLYLPVLVLLRIVRWHDLKVLLFNPK